jgi:HlyD family secretion protein
MKRPPLRPLIALLVIAGLGAAGFWWTARETTPGTLTGYVEGEALHFAAPGSGTLVRLSVERGDRVQAGGALFEMDSDSARARIEQAASALAASQARAEDAGKGQRPEELAVIAAGEAAASARLEEARAELARVRTLAERGVAAPARLDQAETAFSTAQAAHREAISQIGAARLGAREDQARAAQAEARQAEAALREAEIALAQLSPRAPADALVENVFHRPGEWVGANQPVVALLPDERVRLRFFVPETVLPRYRPGREIAFSCDGCPQGLTARITRTGARAEFTPPVIYSQGSREKLVFMVEALPADPGGLAPGQPVDIVPLED